MTSGVLGYRDRYECICGSHGFDGSRQFTNGISNSHRPVGNVELSSQLLGGDQTYSATSNGFYRDSFNLRGNGMAQNYTCQYESPCICGDNCYGNYIRDGGTYFSTLDNWNNRTESPRFDMENQCNYVDGASSNIRSKTRGTKYVFPDKSQKYFASTLRCTCGGCVQNGTGLYTTTYDGDFGENTGTYVPAEYGSNGTCALKKLCARIIYDIGPLATYSSLTDKNLAGYFSNTRMRRHLKKAGLVDRRGQIVSENQYRLNMARKEHKKHVKDLLAQAIVHKTLDIERTRQVEIKRKLEEIAKLELVRRVRIETKRRNDSCLIPLFTPRLPRRKSLPPESVQEEENALTPGSLATKYRKGDEDILPYLSPRSSRPASRPQSRHRPRSAPSDRQYTGDSYEADVIYVDDEGRPVTPPKNLEDEARREEIDSRHLYSLDSAALKKYALTLSKIEQGEGMTSPYLITQAPSPPRSARGSRNSYRDSRYKSRLQRPRTANSLSPYRSTKTGAVQLEFRNKWHLADNNVYKIKQVNGTLMLHRQEPAMMHQGEVQTLCEVTMKYFGPNLQLPRDQRDPTQDVEIEQQHCGGNTLPVFKERIKPGDEFTFISRRHRGYPFSLSIFVDGRISARVSTCCEYGHAKGVRLGGKMGQFCLKGVTGATPCYKCKLNAQASPRTLKRPPSRGKQKKVEQIKEEIIVLRPEKKKQQEEEEVEHVEVAVEGTGLEDEDDNTRSHKAYIKTESESDHNENKTNDYENVVHVVPANQIIKIQEDKYDDDFEDEEGSRKDSGTVNEEDFVVKGHRCDEDDDSDWSAIEKAKAMTPDKLKKDHHLRPTTPIVGWDEEKEEAIVSRNDNTDDTDSKRHVHFDEAVQCYAASDDSETDSENAICKVEKADEKKERHKGKELSDENDTCDEISDIETDLDSPRRKQSPRQEKEERLKRLQRQETEQYSDDFDSVTSTSSSKSTDVKKNDSSDILSSSISDKTSEYDNNPPVDSSLPVDVVSSMLSKVVNEQNDVSHLQMHVTEVNKDELDNGHEKKEKTVIMEEKANNQYELKQFSDEEDSNIEMRRDGPMSITFSEMNIIGPLATLLVKVRRKKREREEKRGRKQLLIMIDESETENSSHASVEEEEVLDDEISKTQVEKFDVGHEEVEYARRKPEVKSHETIETQTSDPEKDTKEDQESKPSEQEDEKEESKQTEQKVDNKELINADTQTSDPEKIKVQENDDSTMAETEEESISEGPNGKTKRKVHQGRLKPLDTPKSKRRALQRTQRIDVSDSSLSSLGSETSSKRTKKSKLKHKSNVVDSKENGHSTEIQKHDIEIEDVIAEKRKKDLISDHFDGDIVTAPTVTYSKEAVVPERNGNVRFIKPRFIQREFDDQDEKAVVQMTKIEKDVPKQAASPSGDDDLLRQMIQSTFDESYEVTDDASIIDLDEDLTMSENFDSKSNDKLPESFAQIINEDQDETEKKKNKFMKKNKTEEKKEPIQVNEGNLKTDGEKSTKIIKVQAKTSNTIVKHSTETQTDKWDETNIKSKRKFSEPKNKEIATNTEEIEDVEEIKLDEEVSLKPKTILDNLDTEVSADIEEIALDDNNHNCRVNHDDDDGKTVNLENGPETIEVVSSSQAKEDEDEARSNSYKSEAAEVEKDKVESDILKDDLQSLKQDRKSPPKSILKSKKKSVSFDEELDSYKIEKLENTNQNKQNMVVVHNSFSVRSNNKCQNELNVISGGNTATRDKRITRYLSDMQGEDDIARIDQRILILPNKQVNIRLKAEVVNEGDETSVEKPVIDASADFFEETESGNQLKKDLTDDQSENQVETHEECPKARVIDVKEADNTIGNEELDGNDMQGHDLKLVQNITKGVSAVFNSIPDPSGYKTYLEENDFNAEPKSEEIVPQNIPKPFIYQKYSPTGVEMLEEENQNVTVKEMVVEEKGEPDDDVSVSSSIVYDYVNSLLADVKKSEEIALQSIEDSSNQKTDGTPCSTRRSSGSSTVVEAYVHSIITSAQEVLTRSDDWNKSRSSSAVAEDFVNKLIEDVKDDINAEETENLTKQTVPEFDNISISSSVVLNYVNEVVENVKQGLLPEAKNENIDSIEKIYNAENEVKIENTKEAHEPIFLTEASADDEDQDLIAKEKHKIKDEKVKRQESSDRKLLPDKVILAECVSSRNDRILEITQDDLVGPVELVILETGMLGSLPAIIALDSSSSESLQGQISAATSSTNVQISEPTDETVKQVGDKRNEAIPELELTKPFELQSDPSSNDQTSKTQIISNSTESTPVPIITEGEKTLKQESEEENASDMKKETENNVETSSNDNISTDNNTPLKPLAEIPSECKTDTAEEVKETIACSEVKQIDDSQSETSWVTILEDWTPIKEAAENSVPDGKDVQNQGVFISTNEGVQVRHTEDYDDKTKDLTQGHTENTDIKQKEELETDNQDKRKPVGEVLVETKPDSSEQSKIESKPDDDQNVLERKLSSGQNEVESKPSSIEQNKDESKPMLTQLENEIKSEQIKVESIPVEEQNEVEGKHKDEKIKFGSNHENAVEIKSENGSTEVDTKSENEPTEVETKSENEPTEVERKPSNANTEVEIKPENEQNVVTIIPLNKQTEVEGEHVIKPMEVESSTNVEQIGVEITPFNEPNEFEIKPENEPASVEIEPLNEQNVVESKSENELTEVGNKPVNEVNEVERKRNNNGVEVESEHRNETTEVKCIPSNEQPEVEITPCSELAEVASRVENQQSEVERKSESKQTVEESEPSADQMKIQSKPEVETLQSTEIKEDKQTDNPDIKSEGIVSLKENGGYRGDQEDVVYETGKIEIPVDANQDVVNNTEEEGISYTPNVEDALIEAGKVIGSVVHLDADLVSQQEKNKADGSAIETALTEAGKLVASVVHIDAETKEKDEAIAQDAVETALAEAGKLAGAVVHIDADKVENDAKEKMETTQGVESALAEAGKLAGAVVHIDADQVENDEKEKMETTQGVETALAGAGRLAGAVVHIDADKVTVESEESDKQHSIDTALAEAEKVATGVIHVKPKHSDGSASDNNIANEPVPKHDKDLQNPEGSQALYKVGQTDVTVPNISEREEVDQDSKNMPVGAEGGKADTVKEGNKIIDLSKTDNGLETEQPDMSSTPRLDTPSQDVPNIVITSPKFPPNEDCIVDKNIAQVDNKVNISDKHESGESKSTNEITLSHENASVMEKAKDNGVSNDTKQKDENDITKQGTESNENERAPNQSSSDEEFAAILDEIDEKLDKNDKNQLAKQLEEKLQDTKDALKKEDQDVQNLKQDAMPKDENEKPEEKILTLREMEELIESEADISIDKETLREIKAAAYDVDVMETISEVTTDSITQSAPK